MIVPCYFAMLAEEIAGRPYNKTEHYREISPFLNGRSKGSFDRKCQNISAILNGLGEDWIWGYKPLPNLQAALVEAVERWLNLNPTWANKEPVWQDSRSMNETGLIQIGPPPVQSNQNPPMLQKMLHLGQKIDRAGQDARNRYLGRAGERCVLAHEEASLRAAGRDDLASKIRWVSEEDDGAGYDIASFDPNGRDRLIEVKTTKGLARMPFYITPNELTVAEDHRSDWLLFRLWNFSVEPRAFELRPPLEAYVSLMTTTFKASFH